MERQKFADGIISVVDDKGVKDAGGDGDKDQEEEEDDDSDDDGGEDNFSDKD